MICRFGGCGKPAPCRGLCPGHYQQQRNGQALRPLHQKRALLPNPDMPGTLLVPLTRGMFAIIDERDGPAVGARNWHAITSEISRTAYAGANFTVDGRLSGVPLHRFLWKHWGMPETPEIDHADGNGLNCRRGNLRAATQCQNRQNAPRRADNKTGFKGVCFVTKARKYRASIMANGRKQVLGEFQTAEEAAAAYGTAAGKLHGEFARDIMIGIA